MEHSLRPYHQGYIGLGKGPREVHFALVYTTINCLLERFPIAFLCEGFHCGYHRSSAFTPICPSKMTSPPSPPLRSKFTSKLQNASIIILGGTSGIGYAVAEACVEFRLTISGSRQPKIDATIARLRATYLSSTYPTHISGLACDLSDLATLEANLVSLLDFATSSSSEGSHRRRYLFPSTPAPNNARPKSTRPAPSVSTAR
jgi:hypothetical protein